MPDFNDISINVTAQEIEKVARVGTAPEDGKLYGQKNGSWEEVTGVTETELNKKLADYQTKDIRDGTPYQTVVDGFNTTFGDIQALNGDIDGIKFLIPEGTNGNNKLVNEEYVNIATAGTIKHIMVDGVEIEPLNRTVDITTLASKDSVSGKEDKSNKVTVISSGSTDNEYPSAKCVYDLIGDIETLLIELR